MSISRAGRRRLGLATLLLAVLSLGVQAAPAADASYTSPPWPPTQKTCTRKALGQNPDPAFLSACFYALDSSLYESEGFSPVPPRLLDAYATASFREELLKDRKSLKTKGLGVGVYSIFYLFDEFKGRLYDFYVRGATFDPGTGIAEVRTTLRGFDQSLYIRFVRQGSVWRVDDILPHYDRDKNGKTLRDYLSMFDRTKL